MAIDIAKGTYITFVDNDSLVDYFIFHFFFQLCIEAYPEDWNKVVPFSNATPHILLLRLFETYNADILEAVKQQTPFHKLTYKFSEEQKNIGNTYYQKISKKEPIL